MYTENTSGHGDFSEIQDGLRKWNWGAFWLTWIWGIGHNSYIALLALLPIANFIMPFYLGARGNELAWRNRYWNDLNELHSSQRKWAAAGFIFAGVIALILAVRVAGAIRTDRINASITNKVLEIVNGNEEAKKLLGDDYEVTFKPLLQSVGTSGEKIPTGHTMFVRCAHGYVTIHTSLDRDYSIQKIKISPPDNYKEGQEEITIYP